MALGGLRDFVLPLTIFPLLIALGVKYMYMDHLAAGLDKEIHALCTPPSPYLLNYTRIPSIDNAEHGPCNIVAFFQLVLDSPSPIPSQFLTYLLGTCMPCVLVTIIEAYRYKGKQHWLLNFPTFWLLMTQAATVGLTFPVFWTLIIISRRSQVDTTILASHFKRGEAEALLFGLVLGALAPSAAMTTMNNPFATWVWQLYPLYISFFRDVYMFLFAPKPKPDPRTKTPPEGSKFNNDFGHQLLILRVLYFVIFLVSSAAHILPVYPIIFRKDWNQLFEFLIPAFVSSTTLSPYRGFLAFGFLKWDFILGTGTLALGLLWSAKSLGQLILILVWYAISIPILGMGGAIMGVLAWRDVL